MQKYYSDYTDMDFLNDDFFIESMNHPTKKTERFWSELIDKRMIDVNEFISANMLLDSIRKNRHTVPTSRKNQLWVKIDKSRLSIEKKNKKIHLYKYPAIAACCIALISVAILLLFDREPISENIKTDYSEFQNLTRQPDLSEIRIIAQDRKIDINGPEAEIKYDSAGSVSINNLEMNPEEATQQVAEITNNQLQVPYGKRATLTLADGSQLWVNAGTTVIYPTLFGEKNREIFVEGEIYAEITHDEDRPFTVKTKDMEVRVLGTSFNLSAYEDETFNRVVLVDGVVNIQQDETSTQLSPGQLYTHTQNASHVMEVDPEIYTSWRYGIYIFKNEPIENILNQLGRYYNVKIHLPAKSSGIVCSGKLELKEDIAHILSNLSQIGSFNYGAKGNDYKIQFY